MPETIALIALGANLGDSKESLDLAFDQLQAHSEITLRSASSYFRTRPVGGPLGQPLFLNGAASVHTRLTACELLSVLKAVESDLGRIRHETWSARRIDLDLIAYGDSVFESEALILPHPRMTVRRFVIDPMMEIEPEWLHPQLLWKTEEIRDHMLLAPRKVNLGPVLARLKDCAACRLLLERFPEVSDGWDWDESSTSAMFEVYWNKDFMLEKKWRLPRFFPTLDQPALMMEQLIATCRGMTFLG